MPCPFAEGKSRLAWMPISVVHDFADLPILLGGEKDRAQVGNQIIPGSELPTEENAETADDEPKDNPCI